MFHIFLFFCRRRNTLSISAVSRPKVEKEHGAHEAIEGLQLAEWPISDLVTLGTILRDHGDDLFHLCNGPSFFERSRFNYFSPLLDRCRETDSRLQTLRDTIVKAALEGYQRIFIVQLKNLTKDREKILRDRVNVLTDQIPVNRWGTPLLRTMERLLASPAEVLAVSDPYDRMAPRNPFVVSGFLNYTSNGEARDLVKVMRLAVTQSCGVAFLDALKHRVVSHLEKQAAA